MFLVHARQKMAKSTEVKFFTLYPLEAVELGDASLKSQAIIECVY